MLGRLTFKTIEAFINRNTDLLGKMQLYCSFFLDHKKVLDTPYAAKTGKNPMWNGAFAVDVNDKFSVLSIRILDHDRLTKDDLVAECHIPLSSILNAQASNLPIPLTYKNAYVGEIRFESSFESIKITSTTTGGQGKTSVRESTDTLSTAAVSTSLDNLGYSFSKDEQRERELQTIEAASRSELEQAYRELRTSQQGVHKKFFVEHREVVEDHKFLKELNSTDIVKSTVQVEVLKSRNVKKEVEYTEEVPVTRKIQTFRPVEVIREIEVVEPRVVTKQIQVVENVRVKRPVKVVEMQMEEKEIQVVELVTRKKTVEVTEQYPELETLEISAPVTVSECVEFVEPVITTQTIVKEYQEAIVIDQKITQEVGPMTVLGLHHGHCPIDVRSFERESSQGLKSALGERSTNKASETRALAGTEKHARTQITATSTTGTQNEAQRPAIA